MRLLLDDSKQEISIFLLLYPKHSASILSRSADLLLHHANPQYVSHEAEGIAELIVKRLMMAAQKDAQQNFVKDSDGFVVMDSEKWLEKSRFSMYRPCYGDAMGKQVDVCVASKLKGLGVRDIDITFAQDQMFVLSLLGVGGEPAQPIKTISISHPCDTYPARFGSDTNANPKHRYIEVHSPASESGFHNPSVCLDPRYQPYPHLLKAAIQEAVKSDKLPELAALYNPSRFHSETQENPRISEMAMRGELKGIRDFMKSIVPNRG